MGTSPTYPGTCIFTPPVTVTGGILAVVLPQAGGSWSYTVGGFRPMIRGTNYFCAEIELYVSPNQHFAITTAQVNSTYGPNPGDVKDCANFTTQRDAQLYYNQYPGDPSNLDPDRNGIACDYLQCPCLKPDPPPSPPVTQAPPAAAQTLSKPAPSPEVSISKSLAVSKAKGALKRKYGRAYAKGKKKRLACKKQTADSYRCAYSFRYRRKTRSGNVTVRKTSAGLKATVKVRR